MAIVQRKPSSGTASKIASCLSFLTSSEKWSPIRLILVTYQPGTSWVISTRAKHKLETLPEGPQTVIVVFAMRTAQLCVGTQEYPTARSRHSGIGPLSGEFSPSGEEEMAGIWCPQAGSGKEVWLRWWLAT